MMGMIEDHQGACMVMMGMYDDDGKKKARCEDHEKLIIMGRNDDDDDDGGVGGMESSLSSFDDEDDDDAMSKGLSSLSSCTSELSDDASSSSSSSLSSQCNGPLYELQELMAHLPIKRGLSKYYQGKSQSFTTLARATSIEDLAKKETPYQRRLKACLSYGGGLNKFKSYTLPKPTISKKTSSKASSLSCLIKRGSFLAHSRPALLSPVHD